MGDDRLPLESGDNLPEFTVSELSFAVKRTIEGSFEVVRVRGEVSGLKRHSSGHVYFTLQDEKAVLSAICWRGMAAKLRFQPEDGLEVICTGRLTTYAGRSQYQIIVDHVEPAGEGAMLKLLEDRRKALAAGDKLAFITRDPMDSVTATLVEVFVAGLRARAKEN